MPNLTSAQDLLHELLYIVLVIQITRPPYVVAIGDSRQVMRLCTQLYLMWHGMHNLLDRRYMSSMPTHKRCRCIHPSHQAIWPHCVRW